MAITDKEKGVWGLDQVYNKINQGSIWTYTGVLGLWGSGQNNGGQLGQNNRTAYSSPIQVGSDSPSTWSSTAGHFSVMDYASEPVAAIKTDGTLWTWGGSPDGSGGRNNNAHVSSPVQIPGTNWHTVNARNGSMGATKTDGTMWVWGLNSDGQLGLNNKTSYSSPKQIPGTTWGVVHSVGIAFQVTKTDGTLWCWGDGYSGNLGQGQDGTPSRRSSPVQVPGTWSTHVGAISATYGQFSTMAIRGDGTLWAWGSNGAGCFGRNDQVDYSSPKQVGTDTTWKYIAGGKRGYHATKTDGTAWSWGDNEAGQLGLSNNTYYSSPVQLPGTNWGRPANYDYWGTWVKTDGTAWAMGNMTGDKIGLNNTNAAAPGGTLVQIPDDTWVDYQSTRYWSMGIKQT